jgi:hypothetical protein
MRIKQVMLWLRPNTFFDVLGLLSFIIAVWQILADYSHKQQLVLAEREHEREIDSLRRKSISEIEQWRGRAVVFGYLALFLFAVLVLTSRKA